MLGGASSLGMGNYTIQMKLVLTEAATEVALDAFTQTV